LGVYLFFTERRAHGETRSEFIIELKKLHAERIADFNLWLNLLMDFATKTKIPPVFPPQPAPQVKTQQIDSK
jgi:hypothetical protein